VIFVERLGLVLTRSALAAVATVTSTTRRTVSALRAVLALFRTLGTRLVVGTRFVRALVGVDRGRMLVGVFGV
jgi:hypothetical protein